MKLRLMPQNRRNPLRHAQYFVLCRQPENRIGGFQAAFGQKGAAVFIRAAAYRSENLTASGALGAGKKARIQA
ncbi:hypothetical protein OP500_02450 [Kingella sp. SNUBH-2017]|uniref:hypothetical protein n=1 Tax=Kingella sp. SNUBH-2017 TaxID=2994077 RepID=UPI0023638946|nr:hypothetical protein [Kingella sp. SNUBH-2017]MDD2182184.1 hypothetical protein [Kingella sp. SNUBH-2017]